jgi:hypothetical protein
MAIAAPAHAATLTVTPRDYSPLRAPLQISATLTVSRQVGLRLATPNGHAVGWIVPPARRTALAIGWDGRIGGRRVPNGNYLVRLIYRSAVLATAPLRIDTHPPQLLNLRTDNGSTGFAGDTPLLTTVSANGDGFRDHANISFHLQEEATVTMEVTRTVKVPTVIYTLTTHFGRGTHTMTWNPAPSTSPGTESSTAHRTRSSGGRRAARSSACKASTRASRSRATCPATSATSTSRPTSPR